VTKQVEFTPEEWRNRPPELRDVEVDHHCVDSDECQVFVCRDLQGFSCGRYSCQSVGGSEDNRCAQCWFRWNRKINAQGLEAIHQVNAAWKMSEPWAIFSPCERYRYALGFPVGANRIVPASGTALLVAANPSTATQHQTDPTVARWIERCRRMGFEMAVVANVRAWRETDPKKVPADPQAIEHSPLLNDAFILELARRSELVVCGWGKLGGERGREVLTLHRAAWDDARSCEHHQCWSELVAQIQRVRGRTV
jgi:hypothetical protein